MSTRNELRGFLKQSLSTEGEVVDGADSRRKRLGLSRKECVSESNDELVKYMSKLPGYLQRKEGKEESVQSNNNVLNVGVLDWGRLEKWKNGRGRDCSNNGLSRGGGRERSEKSERKVSNIATSSSSRVVPKESHRCKIGDDELHTCSNPGKVKGSRDLEHSVCGVRSALELELASRDLLHKQGNATCGRDHKRVNLERRRRSRSYQEMGNSGGSLRVVPGKETRKRAEEIYAQEATESGERLDEEEKIIGDTKAGLNDNIVHLRSRKQNRSSLPGEPLEDENMRVAREGNRSLDFYNGIHSSLGPRSQIPRSCPLSLDLERDSEDIKLPLGVDKRECFGGRRHSKTASRIFDQEVREDESRNNRQPSPSKRFSFSFGRLSKSFSSKEDSAGQLFSSSDDTINSDSTRFDGSSNPEKQNNAHSGSRVSPLRRLIDPLLKSKGSNEKPLQDEKKQDTPKRTRALFQLTVRNGIPLFQFVVNAENSSSSRIILGGTMKNSAFLKDDSVQYCTFYSVNEVKKKKTGSWLIHGHKEKQLGFVYNVIGQMEMSNNTLGSDINEQKPPNVRESVLFEESEQVKGRKEVAAVVIKKKPVEEYFTSLEETTVIIPGGVHSFPEQGAPSPLINRWRSGGLCDCGGWDEGCKLHLLSNKTFLHEFDKSFKLFDQEGSEQESGPVLAMREVKTGVYRVEFGSFLSALQAFFVCVTVITCGNEEDRVVKTTGKSSSPFVPPLSPVGRV